MAVDFKSGPKFSVGDEVFVVQSADREEMDSNEYDPMKHLNLDNYKGLVGKVEKVMEMGDGMRGNKFFYKVKFNVGRQRKIKTGPVRGHRMSNISYLVMKEDEIFHSNEIARLLY